MSSNECHLAVSMLVLATFSISPAMAPSVSSLVFSIRTFMAVYSSNFVLPQILVNLDGEEGH